MKEKVLKLYKNEGETPLECLDRFRREHPIYDDAILSYVGRLDPMAEGLLLVVVDEENKNRNEYLSLDKTYEVDILFGIKTDTGDILGVVNKLQGLDPYIFQGVQPLQLLSSFVGEFKVPYPAYSSKTVKGKSLFVWAREGKLSEINRPEKISEIKSIRILEEYSLNSKELMLSIEERIRKVKGDFRQEEIVASWRKNLKDINVSFEILRIEVSSTSGTYMRSLAEAIGERLGTSAIA